jgi:hypothetical protein
VDFPSAVRLRNVCADDYLYLIYHGRIHGRLRIKEVEYAARTMEVGTQGQEVDAQTILWVECPGESAGERNIRREGHMGFRYDEVPEW